jgi:hypothetical protein
MMLYSITSEDRLYLLIISYSDVDAEFIIYKPKLIIFKLLGHLLACHEDAAKRILMPYICLKAYDS